MCRAHDIMNRECCKRRIKVDSVLMEIKRIALKYGAVKKVVLFGSRARKDNTEYSDYDIAVFRMMHSRVCYFKTKRMRMWSCLTVF